MVSETIADIVKRYLEVVVSERIPVSAGVIYGSHARQQEDAWSDIDLLVISPRFDEPRRWKDVTRLWHIAARVDSRIEPVPVGQR
jgi:predicted nucleotidyltransferase